ncbi:response regulator [Psychromonas sp. KJ10-10]|uniref:response regulator n=1 Tax=Psychromonas sp. KJ10-10 TaxID=3391823 RepID=UPI0039B5D22C
MNILQLQSTTPPDLSTPREFRHQLEAVINLSVNSLTIRQRILLCISEALTNLVIHGQPDVQNIKLDFACDENSWYMDIIDDGRPFDPNQQLDDNLLLNFTEAEDGRGIALLHSQSDELSYRQNKENHTNHLRLRWYFPEPIKQKTVLIVEDNNSLRFLYQSYLSNNFRVLTANNGYQALDSLKSQHIDLVISDIRMPEMNGLTLRKKINQQTSNQLIPFIFLTGEDAPLIQEQAAELGIDDYLIKPVNKPQLLLTIERVLSRSKQVYQKLSNHLDSKITASLTPCAPENINAWHFQLATRNTGGGEEIFYYTNTLPKIPCYY